MTAYDVATTPRDLRRPVGLALSGGGFRAMLFHVGALVRLNEMRLLHEIDEVSGVSGGAIVAGRLAVIWPRLRFRLGSAINLWEELAAPLLDLAGRRLDIRAVTRALLPGISAARQIERAYRDGVVGRATLADLPVRPRFSFLAVHLASGAPWVFDRHGAESPAIGNLRDDSIPLSRAMAASSAYPPFLAPLVMHMDPAKVGGQALVDPRAVLADGGMHDNLGLHRLWDRCATVLSSDAGGVLQPMTRTSSFWLRQLIRSLEIHADRSRTLRRHAALEELRAGRKDGALWRTDSDLSSYPVGSAFPVDVSWPPYLARIRTRLDRFGMIERCHLVNWGYLVADVALRSHVLRHRPPIALPFPKLNFLLPVPSASGRRADAEAEGHPILQARAGVGVSGDELMQIT